MCCINSLRCCIVVALSLTVSTVSARAEEKSEVKRPYKTAHMEPLDAKQEVVKETDKFTKYRIEFNGIEGDRVPAYLYVPKGADGKLPAVLSQYGSGGHKDVDYIVAMDEHFASKGMIALTIDSPGRGERDAPAGGGGNNPLARVEVIHQYCGDYSRAVDFLVSREEVDPDRIGYMGISFGSITGVPYVAHDPRIKTMVSVVGGGGMGRRFGALLGEEGRKKIDAIDPSTHVGLFAPRPLLLINAEKDELIPRTSAESLQKAAGKGSKIVWMDTDHYFRNVDHLVLRKMVHEFLAENLPAK